MPRPPVAATHVWAALLNMIMRALTKLMCIAYVIDRDGVGSCGSIYVAPPAVLAPHWWFHNHGIQVMHAMLRRRY